MYLNLLKIMYDDRPLEKQFLRNIRRKKSLEKIEKSKLNIKFI